MTRLLQIKSRLDVEIAVSEPMDRAIAEWMNMYTGNAPWLSEEVVSMNLPAFIASEVARLATIEMKSEVAGSKRADYLNEQYRPVVDDVRLFTEYAAAGGSLALKPYVIGTDIMVDYVKAGDFFPTAFNASGDITGCLFVDSITRGDSVFTRVERHSIVPEGCRITNEVFETKAGGDDLGKPIALTDVHEWAELLPEMLLENVDRPLFAILKMPFANTIDPGSPLGVSAYARAVDLIREADKQFSRLLWEMESGDRAMYVDVRAIEHDGTELGRLPIKRFYRMLDVDPESQGDLFKEWSPSLREQNQLNALDAILRKVEDACGLSRGSLSQAPESNAGGAKTATELKIMRQRTYATIRDTQKAVETALREMLWAMDMWATLGNLADKGDYDVSFEFDDSVVTDRETEFGERQRLVAMGAMQPWEVRAWYLGEPEEKAKAGVRPMQEDGTWFGHDA